MQPCDMCGVLNERTRLVAYPPFGEDGHARLCNACCMTRLQTLATEAKAANDDLYLDICKQMNALLSKTQLEQLAQLVKHGPVYDGDVCSKAARGDLFLLGLASRACHRGQQGYTVANYFGSNVLDPESDKAWRTEYTLLSTPLDELDNTELQARFEIEERHADEVMQRAQKTLRALHERIDGAQTP